MNNPITVLSILAASILAAPSCQLTEVERGQEGEGAVGSFSGTYDEQRDRVRLIEVEEHLRAGRTDAARRALAELPESERNPQLQLLFAEALIADGDFGAARLALGEALALGAPGSRVALLGAWVAELEGNWDAAAAAYLHASALHPRDTSLLVGHARTLMARGELMAAVNYLERETARFPDAADLAAAAGSACLAIGRYREASNHYTRGVVLEPNDFEMARGLVLAFSLGGFHSAALTRAERFQPEQFDQVLNLTLGRSALVDDQPEKAIRYLGAFLDLEEDDSGAWLDLARANYMLARYDASLEAIRRSLMHGRPNSAALTLLGHIRTRAGQPALAIGAYRRAIELGAEPELLESLITSLELRIEEPPVHTGE